MRGVGGAPALVLHADDEEAGRNGLYARQLEGASVIHRVGSHEEGKEPRQAAPEDLEKNKKTRCQFVCGHVARRYLCVFFLERMG